MTLLDRYLLGLMVDRLGRNIAIIVAILSLDTLPRLVAKLGSVERGLSLVVQSLVCLAPEYAALGIPIALFLGTALAFRKLAMSGELDVMAATGVRTARLLRMPVAAGVAAAAILLATTAFVRPAGERRLDAIGSGAAEGQFGIALPARTMNRLGPHTFIYFDDVAADGRLMHGILVSRPGEVATARIGRITEATNRELTLSLEEGMVRTRRLPGVLHFDRLSVTASHGLQAMFKPKPARDRLQRFSLPALFDSERIARAGFAPAMASASAWSRIAESLFCLTLPLFGFALGVPARRSRSAIGIGAGLLVIILYWRASDFIEDRWPAGAALGFGLLIGGFVAAAILLVRIQERAGFGAIEAWLRRIAVPIGTFVLRPRRWFDRPPLASKPKRFDAGSSGMLRGKRRIASPSVSHRGS